MALILKSRLRFLPKTLPWFSRILSAIPEGHSITRVWRIGAGMGGATGFFLEQPAKIMPKIARCMNRMVFLCIVVPAFFKICNHFMVLMYIGFVIEDCSN